MTDQTEDLAAYGWSDWFESRHSGLPRDRIARITGVERELFWVVNGCGTARAGLSGSWRHHHTESGGFPCVGDWVLLAQPPGGGTVLIDQCLERRTMIRRKAAGGGLKPQMIAANVDHGVVVQSCHFDFNPNRLARYLVMIREGGAAPCVLLTKTDLVSHEVLDEQLNSIRAGGMDAPVYTLSNTTREGLADFERTLIPGKTYCFIGSSGVGKSTLINHLLGRTDQATGEVSGTGEGRHTTVSRQLMRLGNGALVVDNPGMREFGLLEAASAIQGGFSDIATLSGQCRFRDCTHTAEPGCAVLEALENGAIDPAQYGNFLKLRKESEFHELSSLERRKRDRNFGRMVKSVKKRMSEQE